LIFVTKKIVSPDVLYKIYTLLVEFHVLSFKFYYGFRKNPLFLYFIHHTFIIKPQLFESRLWFLFSGGRI